MCIALLSTAHPSYKLILINNRDEYVNRPTARAGWWSEPHTNVLGGRDLLREAQGTWLGITKSGKIAVLTNFREDQAPLSTAISRGEIIKKFLTEDVGSTSDFVRNTVDTGIAKDAGGFSLVCGRVDEKLAVISNRAVDKSQVPWICGDMVHTVGLSNAAFLDHSWKKVTDGEELMLRAVRENIEQQSHEDELVSDLFDVLSQDTLLRNTNGTADGLETHISDLRNTILVPPLGRKDSTTQPPDKVAAAKSDESAEVVDLSKLQSPAKFGSSGIYATQRQTIVLITQENKVRFIERTLYDGSSNPVPIGTGDIEFAFDVSK